MKINLTYYLLLLLLSAFSVDLISQELYVKSGLNTAEFRNYRNSLGGSALIADFKKPKIYIEGGYLKRSNSVKGLSLMAGLNYSKYKINVGVISGNVVYPISYSLNYLSFKIGADFKFIDLLDKRLYLHANLSFSYDILTSGTVLKPFEIEQNLMKSSDFDKTFLRIHPSLKALYKMDRKISYFIGYTMGFGLREENKDSSPGESYSFKTNTISAGLIYSIKQKGSYKFL